MLNEANKLWYQKKRWWLAITLTTIIILILTFWTTRNRHTTAIVSPYLEPYNLSINCLDWSVNFQDSWKHTLGLISQQNTDQQLTEQESILNQPNLEIEKLCLSHPLGEINIENLIIDNPKAPNVVFVGNVEFNANTTLGELIKLLQPHQAKTAFSNEKLLSDIHQQISKALIPFNFALGQVTIKAPNLAAPIQITGSQGAQHLVLIINQQQQSFTLNINYQNQRADVNANIKINEFINTLAKQQLAIPKTLLKADIQGQIQTDINYQKQQLNINYQAQNLQAKLAGIPVLLPKSHDGKLTINQEQTQWQNGSDDIHINLKGNTNDLVAKATNTLSVSQQQNIKQFLAANPINSLAISIANQAIVNIHQNAIGLSQVYIKANERLLDANIKNLTYHLKNQTFALDLSAKSEMTLPQLSQFTQKSISATINTRISGQQNHIQLSEDNQITVTLNNLNHQQISAKKLNMNAKGPIELLNNQLNADISSNIALNQFKHPKLATIDSITLKTSSKLNGPLDNTLNFEGSTQISLNHKELLKLKTAGQANKLQLNLTGKDISLFDLIALNQSNIELPELVSGALDVTLKAQINDIKQPLNGISGQFALKDVSGEHKNTWFEQLNYQQNFIIDNGILKTRDKNNLTINKIETSTELRHTKAQINYQIELPQLISNKNIQPIFSLDVENVSTQAFGGKFSFKRISWPDDLTLDLTIDAVDLAKIVALEKQQGIVVTGLISGALPTSLEKQQDKWKVSIANGELKNITDGVIQIMNNPAVKRLKDSRNDLKLAFDALQNLHYHLLSSEVTMTDDGQMYLETVIKGVNPDLDNEVNFNLNLDYDLLGLLQSALISKKVEQQVNEKVQ